VRTSLAIGLVVVAVAAPTRSADACSCDPVDWLIPADGATAVSTALPEIIYAAHFSDPVSLASDTESVPLGAPIRLWPGNSTQSLVAVLAPLAPETTYRLSVSDYVALSFTTGTGPDVEPPPALVFGPLEIARADYVPNIIHSCGNSPVRFRADVTSTGEEPAAIDVRLTGDGAPQEFVLPFPWGLRKLTNQSCGVDVTVEQDEEYCVEIRARDVAGNLGPPVTQCAVVRACQDIDESLDLFTCPVKHGGCLASRPDGGTLVVVGLALLVARRRRR
jgi:hypothetical protein